MEAIHKLLAYYQIPLHSVVIFNGYRIYVLLPDSEVRYINVKHETKPIQKRYHDVILLHPIYAVIKTETKLLVNNNPNIIDKFINIYRQDLLNIYNNENRSRKKT